MAPRPLGPHMYPTMSTREGGFSQERTSVILGVIQKKRARVAPEKVVHPGHFARYFSNRDAHAGGGACLPRKRKHPAKRN